VRRDGLFTHLHSSIVTRFDVVITSSNPVARRTQQYFPAARRLPRLLFVWVFCVVLLRHFHQEAATREK